MKEQHFVYSSLNGGAGINLRELICNDDQLLKKIINVLNVYLGIAPILYASITTV
jgi:hypothetical protein